METSNPVHQKRLGKSVKNFDLSVWQGAVSDILKTCSELKFNQAKHCGDFLRSTQNRTLGEVNANDNFYGTGKDYRIRMCGIRVGGGKISLVSC